MHTAGLAATPTVDQGHMVGPDVPLDRAIRLAVGGHAVDDFQVGIVPHRKLHGAALDRADAVLVGYAYRSHHKFVVVGDQVTDETDSELGDVFGVDRMAGVPQGYRFPGDRRERLVLEHLPRWPIHVDFLAWIDAGEVVAHTTLTRQICLDSDPGDSRLLDQEPFGGRREIG